MQVTCVNVGALDDDVPIRLLRYILPVVVYDTNVSSYLPANGARPAVHRVIAGGSLQSCRKPQ